MNRQQLILNNYIYIAEHYDANIDLKDNLYYQEYVMLRNYEIINEVIVDKDIYFIEKDVYFDVCKDMKEKKSKYTDIISFPIPNNNVTGYSNYYINFNDLYNENSFCSNDENIGNDVYELYDKNGNYAEILCDLIKLYHPSSKLYINGIIHIYNIINGITFHYICKPYNKFKVNSETELIIDNEKYSEYIEIYVPNLKTLFYDNEIFFYDDVNLSVSELNTEFINKKSLNSFSLRGNFVLQGYNIDDINNILYKNDIVISINDSPIVFKDKDNNILLNGIIIGYDENKYPIINVDNKNNTLSDISYILSCTKYLQIAGYPISINNKLSYKTYDVLYSLNLFIQPFKIVEEKTIDNISIYVKQYLKLRKSLENNYLNYSYNIVLYPYSYLEENTNLYIIDEQLNGVEISFFEKYNFELKANLGFNNGKISLISKFLYPESEKFSTVKDAYKYFYNVSDDEYKTYKETIENSIKEEICDRYNIKSDSEFEKIYKDYKNELEEDLGISIDFVGFRVAISSDNYFKNIIWQKNIYINFDELDNYNININDIFNNWSELPDQLICSVQFIDRYLGNLIKSNHVVITKEWFKYIINSGEAYILKSLNKYNESMKEIILNENSINFINNITCVVNKQLSEQNIIGKTNTPKILYKPYFYRTQELQNIKLRNSLIQNIGINLSEYMTKVETFKIIIDDKEYIEKGRNDIYVIFNINAKELKNTYGKYDIFNQDDEYISTGNYTIY